MENESMCCPWYVDVYTRGGARRGNERCGVYTPDGSWEWHRLHHVLIHLVDARTVSEVAADELAAQRAGMVAR